MRLSALTRWVVAGVLAGLNTAAIGGYSGYLDVNGTFTTLNAPGAADTLPFGISNAGQVVGYGLDRTSDGSISAFHGFLYAGGTYSRIDASAHDTFLYDINNAGQIIGTFSVSATEQHAFLKDGNTFNAIEVPGAHWTTPQSINDKGNIVGNYLGSDGADHGFLKVGSTFTTIEVPGAAGLTFVMGINNTGSVVGTWYEGPAFGGHGFIYADGVFTNIDVPGAETTIARGINDNGDIVGIYWDIDYQHGHGFLYSDGVFHTIDAPDVQDTFVVDINNAGTMVVQTILPDVPEPGTLALFSVGLLGLGLIWRHRRAARIH